MDRFDWLTWYEILHPHDWLHSYARIYKNVGQFDKILPARLGSTDCSGFFFRRTSKVGFQRGNNGPGSKSKLLPIAKLIQRQMFWICNLFPYFLWANKCSQIDAKKTRTTTKTTTYYIYII